jgi:hypothetical protein
MSRKWSESVSRVLVFMSVFQIQAQPRRYTNWYSFISLHEKVASCILPFKDGWRLSCLSGELIKQFLNHSLQDYSLDNDMSTIRISNASMIPEIAQDIKEGPFFDGLIKVMIEGGSQYVFVEPGCTTEQLYKQVSCIPSILINGWYLTTLSDEPIVESTKLTIRDYKLSFNEAKIKITTTDVSILYPALAPSLRKNEFDKEGLLDALIGGGRSDDDDDYNPGIISYLNVFRI